MTHNMSRSISKASTAASVDLSDTSNGSPKASMESPDMHLHNDSLCPQNQFLRKRLHKATCQLHHQQKMVSLLMKEVEKEQERCYNMENALLESCSCLGHCCQEAQFPVS